MKHWANSRTIIVGALAVVLPIIELNFHLLKPVLSESAYNVALMVISALGALFIYLRTITTGPVKRSQSSE